MRMLVKFGTLGALCAMLALSPAKAEAALILTPADADATATFFPPNNCEPGCVETAFSLTPGSLTFLYKADSNAETGPFAGSYNTTFSNSASDPQDADIVWVNGQPSISCPECYLAVKDGNHTPTYYFFDISSWNGTETIQLRGFWPGAGAISHVSIFGIPGEEPPGGGEDTVVPEPASLLLLGFGALMAGRRVRRRFAL